MILQYAKRYLGAPLSYRASTQHDGRPVLYDDREDEKMATQGSPALAPSSVWRWLTWLGGLEKTLQAAQRLIQQKEPNSALHREPWAPPVNKYRSQPRRNVLQRAMRCLVVGPLFHDLFGRDIFPDLATAHGWS